MDASPSRAENARQSSRASISQDDIAKRSSEGLLSCSTPASLDEDLTRSRRTEKNLVGEFFDDSVTVVARITRKEYERLRSRANSFVAVPLGPPEERRVSRQGSHESDDHHGHLDKDIDDVFAGLVEGVVPHMAAEFHACDPFYIIVVHVIGIALLFARLVMLWHQKRACISEIMKCLGLISSFLVLGVIMPWHATHLQISDAIRRLLTIREAYHAQSIQHKGLRLVAKYYRCLQPCTIFMATVPSVASFVQVFTTLDDQLSYETQTLSIFIFASGTVWFVLMASFGAAAVELVCIDASEICVEGLASELNQQSELHDTMDWASFHRKCVKFHQVLDSVWDLPGVGGLWLCRVVLLFCASITTGAISLHRHTIWMRVALRIFAASMAAAGSYLLFRLALITLQCADQRPNSGSITELALRCGGRIRGDSERMQYQTFMTYLQMSYIGIQIRGIPITLPFVLMIFGNMVGTFQLALFYTEHILFPQDQGE